MKTIPIPIPYSTILENTRKNTIKIQTIQTIQL